MPRLCSEQPQREAGLPLPARNVPFRTGLLSPPTRARPDDPRPRRRARDERGQLRVRGGGLQPWRGEPPFLWTPLQPGVCALTPG